MIEAKKSAVPMTCSISPSQWEGQTVEGVSLYIRYRWGRLTVQSPFDQETFMNEPLLSVQVGDEYDGEMDTEEMYLQTKEVIKWIDETEEHIDTVADAINALLDDLEQDVIGEMLPPQGVNRKRSYADGYDDGWNQALDWLLERLKTYRRE